MSSYQCGSHTIRINDANEGKIIDIARLCGRVCGPMACQRCVAKRCRKITKGIIAERENGSGKLQWVLVDENNVDSIKDNLKRWMTRHCRLPLENEVIFILEDDHRVRRQTKPLPEDKDELNEWVKMACQTPKKKRMSGTRSRKDKSTGEILIAGWGYPKPKSKPVEGRTSHYIVLPLERLRAHSEPAGATLDTWHSLIEDKFGSVKYDASPDVQEAIMEILEMKGFVMYPDDNGPIFDTGDALWTPGV